MNWLMLYLLPGSSVLAMGLERGFLFQKSKKNKKAAVTLLSPGTGSALAGTILFVSGTNDQIDRSYSEEKNIARPTTGSILIISGTAAALTSLTLKRGHFPLSHSWLNPMPDANPLP